MPFCAVLGVAGQVEAAAVALAALVGQEDARKGGLTLLQARPWLTRLELAVLAVLRVVGLGVMVDLLRSGLGLERIPRLEDLATAATRVGWATTG